MNPALGARVERFRDALAPLAWRIGVVMAAFVALRVGILLLEREPVRTARILFRAGPMLLLIFATLWAITTAAIWLATLVWPTTVFEGGIRSTTIFGNARSLAWSEVVRVTRLELFLFAYFRLHAADGPSIFVSTRLRRMHDFRRQIQRLAGDSHPFVRALGPAP